AFRQTLSVRMDPRVNVPASEIEAEYAAARRISEALGRGTRALAEVRGVIAAAKQRAAGLPAGPAADAVTALSTAAAAIEGGSTGRRGRRTGPSTSLARVNGRFSELLTAVDQADAAPTAAQAEALAETERSLDAALARWKEIREHELAAANSELARAGVA